MNHSYKSFKEFPNDPYGVRIYTLENGLKVYLSQNRDEPRIKTRIAVKAGATSDPSEATGLAHYVEHMMFKGTDLIGALNRDKEESIISKIKSSYEELALAESTADIKRINNDIDVLSSAASLEAIPGELDKLYSIMGCRSTNARTGFEETVYENDIPKVELERWISLEKERFTSPVLRLFPPELEVVYEEFNQSQDDDVSRAFDVFLKSMFPRHPYGRAGILGKGDHLKKPSMEKIEEFLHQWYVPSNMAIILTGDLEFDFTIDIINEYWGSIKKGNPPVKNAIIEEVQTKAVIKTVYGPDSPFVLMGFRFEGFGSEDELYLTLIDMIMSNNQAGTLDLNLVQKQRVLEAESSYEVYRDYSWFSLFGVPNSSQSLKQVVSLLLKEIELLKKGEFESWYNDAVITCFEIDKLNELDGGSIESFVDAFVTGLSWDNYLKRIDILKSITFDDLVNFINKKFTQNYSIVYKKKGTPKNILYIKKPNLTPVVLNRDVESEFCSSFKKIKIPRNSPDFPDLSRLQPLNLGSGRTLFHEVNSNNELFDIILTVDKGRFDDLKIHYGVEYRDYIGTDQYSPKEFQQELFKRGLDLVLSSADNKTTISLSGRDRDMDIGLELLLQFLLKGSSNNSNYRKFIRRIALMRKNAKHSKRLILWGGLYNFIHYGTNNPFRYYLTLKQLKHIGSTKLIDVIGKLFSSPFEVYYYGPKTSDATKELLTTFSEKIPIITELTVKKKFDLIKYKNTKSYFVNYDMVQSEIILTGQGIKYDKSLLPVIFLFNEYFGSGMDSVVFQEIRERRGLAYSAYASYSLPVDKYGSFIFTFYVGTQSDKVGDALRCILGLTEFFPKAQTYFDAIKSSFIKNIESDSILLRDYYFVRQDSQKFGLDIDIREHLYNGVKDLTIDDLENFFNSYIKDINLHSLILGNKKNISISEIDTILSRKSKILPLRSIYGY